MDKMLKTLRAAFEQRPFSAVEALKILAPEDLPVSTQWVAARTPGMQARSLGHALGDCPELDKHPARLGNLYRFRE